MLLCLLWDIHLPTTGNSMFILTCYKQHVMIIVYIKLMDFLLLDLKLIMPFSSLENQSKIFWKSAHLKKPRKPLSAWKLEYHVTLIINKLFEEIAVS